MTTALRQLDVECCWEPSPEMLQRLLDHKTRLYDDFDSALLREWVAEWYQRLRPQHPPNFLKFPDRFWKLVAEDKSDEPANKKMKSNDYKMLTSTLNEYTYRILGFSRKDGIKDDTPPTTDTVPVKVVEADGWLPGFCQWDAFQKVRDTLSSWAGLDVWVEVSARRVDICDKEVERRCRYHSQRICANNSKPEDQEMALTKFERNLNSLINGRLTAVYKFPDYKTNRRPQWLRR